MMDKLAYTRGDGKPFHGYSAWPYWAVGAGLAWWSSSALWGNLAGKIVTGISAKGGPIFRAIADNPFLAEQIERAFRLSLLSVGIAFLLIPVAGLWLVRDGRVRRWLEEGSPVRPALALYLLSCLLLLFSHYGIHGGIPITPDEYVYLFQSEVFSSFHVTAPEHAMPEFFKSAFVLSHNGKIFSIFPPGWPLILAVANGLHLTPLAPILIGSLAPMLVFLIMVRSGQPGWGFFAGILLILSPYFFIMGGTYMSHPLALVLVLLFVYMVSGIGPETSPFRYFLMGLVGAFVAPVHHLDVVALLPFGLLLLVRLWKTSSRRPLSLILLMVGGLLPVAFAISYHWATVGDPLGVSTTLYCEQGNYIARNPGCKLFNPLEFDAIRMGTARMVRRVLMLNGVFFPFAVFLSLPWILGRKDAIQWCMFAAILLTLASYILYKLEGGWGLGPRYYFHLAGFMAIALAEGLRRIRAFLAQGLPRRGKCIVTHLVLIGLCLNAGVVAARSVYIGAAVEVLKLPDRLVEANGIRNGLVFINVEPFQEDVAWGEYFFTRNHPGDGGPVIYAVDLGEHNKSLMEHFPGRSFWRLNIDYSHFGDLSQEPRLEPLTP